MVFYTRHYGKTCIILLDIDRRLEKQVNLVDYPAEESPVEALGHGVACGERLAHRVGAEHGLAARHQTALREHGLELLVVDAEQLRDGGQRRGVGYVTLAVAVHALVLHKGQIAQMQYAGEQAVDRVDLLRLEADRLEAAMYGAQLVAVARAAAVRLVQIAVLGVRRQVVLELLEALARHAVVHVVEDVKVALATILVAFSSR